MIRKKYPERLPMVGWYDLGRLTTTAIQTLVSTLIGQHSDRRIIQALASQENTFYDYSFHYNDIDEYKCEIDFSKPRDEMWIDYIADTGDGWNSTAAVAHYAAQPRHTFKHVDHSAIETHRGEVLVFGGDEVYPTPSRENYRKRLIAPFQSAFGDEQPQERPHVFAIPGNHDWYDSLTSFIRLFCSDLSQRRFGGWRTRQHRSYFALRLPQNWWLLGSDGQLHSDLDTPQIEYFRFIADNHMKEGDRVILCVAEPVWIYAHKYEKFGATYNESDLLFLEHQILSRKNIQIKIFLSGDLHHYRRHEERNPKNPASKTQKITAGGGGAFLMGTHGMDFSLIAEETEMPQTKPRMFELKQSYPEPSVSRRLSYRNLLFPFINPWFGILPGFLYMLTVWSVWAAIGTKSPHGTFQSLVFTMIALRNDPALALWLAVVIAGFVFFTDTHSRVYKWAGGIAHAFAHYFCLFHIGWGVTILCNMLFFTHPIINFVLGAVLVFGAGWWVGSFVVGFYLLISLNVFGRHDQEAFSALKIQDYKNFLRMHIAKDGSLTIYPIKIERVPRKWRKTNVPVGGTQPELIEPPIILK